MKRITKGFLLGPLAIVPVVAILYLCLFFFNKDNNYEGILIGLAITSGVGVLVAYLYVGLIGVPVYRLLKRYGHLKLRFVLSISYLSGLTLVPLLQLRLPVNIGETVVMFVFGLAGMLVAYAIWHIGIKEKP